MTDQYLADTQWTLDGFAVDSLPMQNWRASAGDVDGAGRYGRHAFTPDGVSPFAVPGRTRHVVVTDSDEHSEAGHIIEDVETRKKMVEKRLFLKADAIRKEISPPRLFGAKQPETVLVSWGSTYGVVREAAEHMAERNVAMLHFSEIYPFPLPDPFDYLSVLKGAARTISVENNATGQFARLLRDQTGFAVSDRILRYDGRPFLLEELLEELSGRT
jgi:2-oxoglutarate ferredoxin oxidoreductase subunit alpha